MVLVLLLVIAKTYFRATHESILKHNKNLWSFFLRSGTRFEKIMAFRTMPKKKKRSSQMISFEQEEIKVKISNLNDKQITH